MWWGADTTGRGGADTAGCGLIHPVVGGADTTGSGGADTAGCIYEHVRAYVHVHWRCNSLMYVHKNMYRCIDMHV